MRNIIAALIAATVLSGCQSWTERLAEYDEVYSLKPGDVLPLNINEHADLPLEVGGQIKFLGRPGTVGIHKAFRISKEVSQIEDPIHNDTNARLFGGNA